MTKLKRRCRCCGKTFTQNEILTASNPFDATKTVYGCPECKTVNALDRTCEAPGCNDTKLYPCETDNGHMMLCWEHWLRMRKVS